MQLVRRGCSEADALVPVSFFSAGKSTLTAFEICLRAPASFQEKTASTARQIISKKGARETAGRPFSKFHIRRIRGRF